MILCGPLEEFSGDGPVRVCMCVCVCSIPGPLTQSLFHMPTSAPLMLRVCNTQHTTHSNCANNYSYTKAEFWNSGSLNIVTPPLCDLNIDCCTLPEAFWLLSKEMGEMSPPGDGTAEQ